MASAVIGVGFEGCPVTGEAPLVMLALLKAVQPPVGATTPEGWIPAMLVEFLEFWLRLEKVGLKVEVVGL